MTGFTDIHSHLIYGIDDGAQSRADMEAMLDAAYADGIAYLFATSHMAPGVRPFDFAAYRQRLGEACGYCRAKGYAMTLCAGAEILYTPALRQYAMDRRLPTLADSDYALMDFVPDVTLGEMEAALAWMERYGYITVVAHIERYACLFHGGAAGRLKERYDIRYQVNANTVLTERGLFRAGRIRRWFQEGLVDFVASDAHGVRTRPYLMKRAYAELKRRYGQHYAEQLTGLL